MQDFKNKTHPVIDWIEHNLKCSNRQPRFNKRPVRLMDWQKDIIWKIWPKCGQRVIEEVLIDTCRKTGKTEFLAYIITYVLFADDNFEDWPAHWLHSSHTLKQSRIIFEMLKSVIKNSRLKADIKEVGEIYPTDNENSFVYLSGNEDSKLGLNATHASCDESDRVDFNTYQTLEGSIALANKPLFFLLTNAPDDPSSWIKQKIDLGRSIKRDKKVRKYKTFYPVIYETSKRDSFKDPATWQKANPSLGYLIKDDWYKKQIATVANIPAKLTNFKRLHLGLHNYQSEDSWFSPELIKFIPENFTPDNFQWYGGLDLSSSKDLTSFTLISEDSLGNIYLKAWHWIPRARLELRQDRNKKAIEKWLNSGLDNLFISQNETIDLKEIEDKIKELSNKFTFNKIGVDRYKHSIFSKEFSNQFELLSFNQTPANFSSPIIYFEDKALKEKLHCEDPVLKWSIGNVRMIDDLKSSAFRMLHKKKSVEAIDPVVASCMATGLLLKYQESNSYPQLLHL